MQFGRNYLPRQLRRNWGTATSAPQTPRLAAAPHAPTWLACPGVAWFTPSCWATWRWSSFSVSRQQPVCGPVSEGGKFAPFGMKVHAARVGLTLAQIYARVRIGRARNRMAPRAVG